MSGGLLPAPSQVSTSQTFLNLAKLGVSVNSSGASNLAAINAAIQNSQGLIPIYLPAGRYPCANGLKMPNFPIYWYGDGYNLSVLKFSQNFTNPGDYAVGYDNTSSGHVQPGSPWYDNTTNSLNSAGTWWLRGLGFEGNDWGGNLGYGFYFPQWVSLGRTALKMDMRDCAINLFQGVGMLYEINGLAADSDFHNINVANNSGHGIIAGSDSRYVQFMSYSNGGWGLTTDDHRILQLLGAKFYNNGQVDHTCGGVKLIGSNDVLDNIFTQDNLGPGIVLDGGQLMSLGRIVSDRNCWNGSDFSGLVINNCNGVIVDGYLATDTKTLHAATVTGVNALNSAVINVNDTSAFGSSGTFYLCDSALLTDVQVTYAGTTPTSFTGCGNHAATTGGESITLYPVQLHAVKVTGSNTDCVVRTTQQVSSARLGAIVESNSGGCTVYGPVTSV